MRTRRAMFGVMVACTIVAGCGAGRESTTPRTIAGPVSTYVEASRRLVAIPGRLISLLPTVATTSELPDAQEAHSIVSDTRAQLRAIRAIPIRDARLRRQRMRLADGVARLLPDMDRIADDIARRDRSAIERNGRAFLQHVRSLPSVVRTG